MEDTEGEKTAAKANTTRILLQIVCLRICYAKGTFNKLSVWLLPVLLVA